MEARHGRLPREQGKAGVSPSVHNSSSKEEEKEGEDKGMLKYVTERDIPGIGNATADEARTMSQKSCSRLTVLPYSDSALRLDSRQLGSYPETGLWEMMTKVPARLSTTPK
jgi:hypothetical protein